MVTTRLLSPWRGFWVSLDRDEWTGIDRWWPVTVVLLVWVGLAIPVTLLLLAGMAAGSIEDEIGERERGRQ